MYTFVLSNDQVENLYNTKGWSYVEIAKYDQYLNRQAKIKRRGGRSAYKDSEKSKVYSAERNFLYAYEKIGGTVKKFANYKEAERYMKQVMSSVAWKKLTTNRHIDLIEKRDMGGRTATSGLAWGHQIQLCPRTGLNQYVLLHEMAHCAGHMHHDLSFRVALVKLVSRFMSAKAGVGLKKSFRLNGLRMHRKTTVMTPEKWLTSYRKMEQIRTKIAA
jgi:hypothetical protein